MEPLEHPQRTVGHDDLILSYLETEELFKEHLTVYVGYRGFDPGTLPLPLLTITFKIPHVKQFSNLQGLPGCGRAGRLLSVEGSSPHL